ncbi:hypothetical protein [Streptomyces sp. NPDC001056]
MPVPAISHGRTAEHPPGHREAVRVAAAWALDDDRRSDLLDDVEYPAQAAAPPERRDRDRPEPLSGR